MILQNTRVCTVHAGCPKSRLTISCISDTLKLTMCADSNTETKTKKNATDPPPALSRVNSPTMHSKLVCQEKTFLSWGTRLQSPVHAVPGPGRWHR